MVWSASVGQWRVKTCCSVLFIIIVFFFFFSSSRSGNLGQRTMHSLCQTVAGCPNPSHAPHWPWSQAFTSNQPTQLHPAKTAQLWVDMREGRGSNLYSQMRQWGVTLWSDTEITLSLSNYLTYLPTPGIIFSFSVNRLAILKKEEDPIPSPLQKHPKTREDHKVTSEAIHLFKTVLYFLKWQFYEMKT